MGLDAVIGMVCVKTQKFDGDTLKFAESNRFAMA